MNKKILAGLALATAFSVTVPALAHHSGAMFDHDKQIELQGTVVEFQYTNPHSWLMIMVKSADGTTKKWGFEAEGPSTLMRAGIRAKTFSPGDMIMVKANPLKDGRPGGLLLSATKADGTVYTPRIGPPPATPGST
jgi:hypothetical protein